MPRFFRMLIAIAFMIIAISAISNEVLASSNERIVEVRLQNYVQNTSELSIVLKGDYEYDETLFEEPLKRNTVYKLKVEKGQIVVYEGSKKLSEVGKSFAIKPVEYNKNTYTSMILSSGERNYLGELRFTVESDKFIRPFNKLPLEDYIVGVVPREMPASWGEEALKAQAVAARTYYLRSFSNGGIITDTQTHQVYGGYSIDAYTSKIQRVVDGTKGEVLTYNGSLISAVYSSSNGGHTESNEVWGSAPLGYLKAQKDPYDPQHAFSITLEKEQINLDGKDMKNPATWWDSAREVNLSYANSIRSWLAGKGYSGKDIKIASVSKLEIGSSRTSGQRIKDAEVSIEFFVRNQDGSFVTNSDGTLRQHVWSGKITATELRTMLGASNFRSLLVDHFDTPINVEITRVSGQSRIDTAVEVSKELYPNGFPSNHAHKTVFLATSQEFADALSAGPLAAQYGNAPILLTRSNELSETVEKEINRLKAENVIIIGGQTAVSSTVQNKVGQLATVKKVERISGSNRYGTNTAINTKLQNVNGVFVASGRNFADALAAAPIASSNNWAIVLTDGRTLTNEASQFINSKNKSVNILGGTVAVSDEVNKQLQSLVGSSKVKRLSVSGGNRYDTLAVILETFKGSYNANTVLLSTGEDFPDALTSSSLAVAKKSPLVLVGSKKNVNVEKALTPLKNEISTIQVLGGTGAVSAQQVGFIADVHKTFYVIKGKGFGHGIGMSQYGANEMAKQRKSYREILSFYYPGTNLTTR
ncbi:SpoIID/LytB domain-containing protein [Sutcliffiella cohnii]